MKFNVEQCKRIAKHAYSGYPISQYYTVDGLNEAVSHLPEKQRVCLELRYINNLTYREIAGIIGKSCQSARDYVERSMRYLRKPFLKIIVEEGVIKDIDMGTPIDSLKLSCRSYNCLRRAGIVTFGDLVSRSRNDLCKMRNLGSKGIEEISEMMKAYGFCVGNGKL